MLIDFVMWKEANFPEIWNKNVDVKDISFSILSYLRNVIHIFMSF